MTAAQIARQFTRLRNLQRLLRCYEEENGQVCGIQHLRRRVIEQMRKLAKLMRYGVQLALLLLVMPAIAEEHRSHPVADMPLHEKFYQGWFMPDNPARSCCNKADCYPTEARFVFGHWQAKRREDGKWLWVPDAKVERHRDNPDGRNHLCAPPPNASYPLDTVFCFALGAGF